MSFKIRLSLLILGFLTLFNACEGGDMGRKGISLTSLKDIPEFKWKYLSEKTIYFGHMSVGFNLIEGIRDVMRENPRIQLSIVETNDPGMFEKPIFAHSRNGKNHDPFSKINAFVELMDRGLGNKADVAFFKFCFVDITASTDIQKVFAYYKDKMQYLKEKYTKTTFVHITVPLTTVQTGSKAVIKKIIGRPIDGYADNIKRNEFNSLLEKEFEGKEPIFDLAKIESTSPDGKPVSFESDGKTYYAMNSEYTHDRGHLNKTGRTIAAQSLLILLADLIK